MNINFKKLTTKIKFVAEIGKIVFGGKTGKILSGVEGGAEIAEQIKEIVKPSKTDSK